MAEVGKLSLSSTDTKTICLVLFFPQPHALLLHDKLQHKLYIFKYFYIFKKYIFIFNNILSLLLLKGLLLRQLSYPRSIIIRRKKASNPKHTLKPLLTEHLTQSFIYLNKNKQKQRQRENIFKVLTLVVFSGFIILFS